MPIMPRNKREQALAWAEAHKLIRGGADEAAEYIESSQYTIELLLQALRDSACRVCEHAGAQRDPDCEACERRLHLLAALT